MTAQQRLRLRLPAAERDKAFQCRAARTDREELAAEAIASSAVNHTLFLEFAERVGRQQLRPQIAVVTSGVAAGEDVAEAMRETLPRRRMHHRDLLAYLFEHDQRTGALFRIVFEMQQEIEQGEFQLANQEQAGMKVARGQHAFEQFVG